MRLSALAILLVVITASTSPAGQTTPDGDRLYRQQCARCHEAEMPGVFLDGVRGPGSIQEMSAERVYEALLYYFRKRQAATLNDAKLRKKSIKWRLGNSPALDI